VSVEDVRRIVDALYRVHGLISAITDLNTLLERIMEESKRVANAEACSLMLYDAEAQELYFQVAQGETGDQQALKRQVRLKLDQGIAGVAARTRESVNVPDTAKDARFYVTADEISGFRTRSVLAVPLVDRDTLVGVVELLNKEGGGAFTEADLRVMEMFSALAASSIVNARLIEDNLRAGRMAAIGEAVAGLSHYIKNLITGMSNSAELIDTSLRENKREILDTVWPIFKRIVRRMSIFVQDMLAFSKPREPIRELCHVGSLVDEAAETFRGLTPQKKVAIEVDAAEASVPVYVDSRGLFSCLLNLVTNAGDAAPSENGRIRIAARVVKNGPALDLAIEVADNGPGVPEELLHLIFEPFYSTKGSMGTGLGLAVTRKTVREHGGDITVGRSPEGGALFRIVLPDAGRKPGFHG
jgi:signal transduction histidine kinase